MGRWKWAWVTAVPLAWDATVTLTASAYKVFSSNPKLGFFAQRDAFQDAIDSGKVLAPAKSMDDMHAIVTNSTVDGILAAFFAVMIIVVILASARVWWVALRRGEPLPTAETPPEPSAIWAPSGLFPTAEERTRMPRVREPMPAGFGRGGR
jgi:carbon starvation protein